MNRPEKGKEAVGVKAENVIRPIKCHKVKELSQFFRSKMLNCEEEKLGLPFCGIPIAGHRVQFGTMEGNTQQGWTSGSSHSGDVLRNRQAELRSLRLIFDVNSVFLRSRFLLFFISAEF